MLTGKSSCMCSEFMGIRWPPRNGLPLQPGRESAWAQPLTGTSRAFGYTPDNQDKNWLAENLVNAATVFDPTAGGGSVPFEAVRLGFETMANDLNPVAALIERATVEWPAKHSVAIKEIVEKLGAELTTEVRKRLAGAFPDEPGDDISPGRLPLGPHDHLSLLRWSCAAIAQLASCSRWNRGQAQASARLPGPGTHKVVSAHSRSSNRPRSNRAPRWQKATAPAPIPIAGA